MSFLLDALGKAEKDRLRDEVPELRTPTRSRSSLFRRFFRVSLLLSAIVMAFVAGYLLRPYFGASLNSGEASHKSAKPDTKTPSERTALNQQNLSDNQLISNVAKIGEPDSVQGALSSTINLSVISYSDIPAVRFAMVNGFVMHQGDVLATGEQLVLIDVEAIVLEKEGVQTRVKLRK